MRQLHASLACAGLLFSVGCTPYSVGTSAYPLRPGVRSEAATLIVVPAGARSPGDSSSVAVLSVDAEARIGLDEYADMGLRVNGGTGLIGTSGD